MKLVNANILLLAMFLALIFADGCSRVRDKKNGLDVVVQRIIFNKYCKIEELTDSEHEIGISDINHTINFMLLNNKISSSFDFDNDVESIIKKRLVQCELDTFGMERYKVMYEDTSIIRRPIKFRLCNGDLYAKVIPAKPNASLADSSSILLSKPFEMHNGLSIIYYEMVLHKSALDGFAVIENLHSNNPKVIFDDIINIYN